MPSFVIKTREGASKQRPSSPSVVSSSSQGVSKDAEGGPQYPSSSSMYQLQHKGGTFSEANVDQKLALPPKLKAPLKLIDDSFQWNDSILEYLQDINNYYVVGVIGLQGVGKSSLISLLTDPENITSPIFPAQTIDQQQRGEHCTNGVDIYVTNERVILLDAQPILSPSVMDHIILLEKKLSLASDYHSTENTFYVQSLQLVSFMLSVCHTLLVVQEWFNDPSFLRLIQTAEMLKPSSSQGHDTKNSSLEDNSPNIVFVQNKCSRPDFYPLSIKEMQHNLSLIFKKSKLKHSGQVSMGFLNQRNKKTNRDEVNLFLIPDFQEELDNADGPLSASLHEFRGHPGFKSVAMAFNQQILTLPRPVNPTLTEKNWCHYAGKVWDTIKKSSLFLEYSRLIS